jgi:hypothetical protein
MGGAAYCLRSCLTRNIAMPIPLAAPELLNKEFLEIRAKLLETAAALDRLDRAEGSVGGDPRLKQIQEAIGILASRGPDRAERLQLAFSLPYDENWRQKFFRK